MDGSICLKINDLFRCLLPSNPPREKGETNPMPFTLNDVESQTVQFLPKLAFIEKAEPYKPLEEICKSRRSGWAYRRLHTQVSSELKDSANFTKSGRRPVKQMKRPAAIDIWKSGIGEWEAEGCSSNEKNVVHSLLVRELLRTIQHWPRKVEPYDRATGNAGQWTRKHPGATCKIERPFRRFAFCHIRYGLHFVTKGTGTCDLVPEAAPKLFVDRDYERGLHQALERCDDLISVSPQRV